MVTLTITWPSTPRQHGIDEQVVDRISTDANAALARAALDGHIEVSYDDPGWHPAGGA